MIASFDDLIAQARQAGILRIAVAAAHDPEVLKAVDRAQREGIARATLIGDRPGIEAHAAQTGANLAPSVVIHEPSSHQAALRAIDMARSGQADVVVKGQIKTSELLSIALNRHIGIRGSGLITHVGLFELPGRVRFLYLSDSGVVIYPDLVQKLEIINNAVAVAHHLGLTEPKVAILAASATVHPKIPASIDALALTKMADQGWVSGAIVDGPLGLELAISPEAARLEGSQSPISGQADILIVPNVEAGNIVAKGLLYFARARMAGVVVGARVPIVISSRADTADTRYLSLAMAAVLSRPSPPG